MALDLVEKGLITDQIVLTVGYDIENLTDPQREKAYKGPVTTDFYGRKVPKHAHGTYNLPRHTASSTLLIKAVTGLCGEILDQNLLVRRLNITANHVVPEASLSKKEEFQQLDLLADPEDQQLQQREEARLERERKRQQAVLRIKHRYGKNAILRGMNLEEGATAKDRNSQVGGHKA